MRSFKLLERRARYVVAAIGFVTLGVVAPFASAAQVTERSIVMSTAAQDATGVAYQINFTATQAAGAFMLEFCSNTPLIGEACTPPTDFSLASAASTDPDVTAESSPAANQEIVTTTMTADEDVSIDLTGVTNPSVVGPLYARIVTYTDATDAAGYTSTDLDIVGDPIDEGGVALYINDAVNVSGAVLESMTFCVSGPAGGGGNPITANCGGTLTAPTLRLGQDVGGVIALNPTAVYSGTIYTQLSTNASKGAIVSLKSSAVNCGGLLRSSDLTACNIGPAGTAGDIDAGEALFGLKLGADVTDATNGDLVAASANYNSSNYRLNYVGGNASGVTGPYGDPILDTNEEPANNRDMPLTFGASVTNNTPAGNYSAQLSLIATGKF